LVRSGHVTLGGRTVCKPSEPVSPEASLDVADDTGDAGFASRAAFKLVGALEALAAQGTRIDILGMNCLDVGASTGGFTDVLLRRGAAHVVALDVGHDQLLPRLRTDPRVTVIEGRNARDLTQSDLAGPPDLMVGDLSFISLGLVLPALAAVLDAGKPALLLVKPQFEVGRERLGAGGVVKDPALHVEVVLGVIAAAAATGLHAQAVVASPLPGPSGNREFFVLFVKGEPGSSQWVAAPTLAGGER
jgi:23S rRNA (cytidine1920-2'-O)/16S rRNA (cytidine1409-2'-O)-methyltransferase